MMLPELPLSTPALLFPAISLLMLAYTNRFLALANIVRGLHATWQSSHELVVLEQIQNMRTRIGLIKNMQMLGVLSLMMCVVSMSLLFFEKQIGGQVTFGVSLMLMLGSLTLSLMEIRLSGRALDLQLRDVKCREE